MRKRFLTIILTLTAMLTCIFGLSACGEKVNNFKLFFKVDGEVYQTITTTGSESITIPENPTKTGYEFDGWFWDKDVWEKPFTANSLLDAPLSSDMSVYAKFSLNTINGVTFEDVETTYDGTEKTIAINNLPNGASVVYDKANTYINAGEYTVTATISQENYEDLQLTATLTINKATYDMSSVVFANKTVTYNGDAHSIIATGMPSGITATYENNDQINTGKYTVVAKFTGDSNNYELIPNKTATLTILDSAFEGLSFVSKTFTYDGTEKKIEVVGAPSGATITYDKANKYINAGKYTVTATIKKANFADVTLSATLTINKAGVSKPTEDSTSFVYNGNEQIYQILENNLYTISGNKQTNAGNYNVIVSLKDKANYQWSDNNSTDLSYSFNIAKATYNMSSVIFDDKTVTYNGDAHSIIATGMPSGVTATYENNDQINTGKYTVVAKFTGDSNNYELIPSKTATLTILDSAFEGLSFVSKTFTYDGTEKKIEVVGVPSGATITYDKANKYINAGKYTVTATIKKANFAEVTLTATLTINKATYDMSGVIFADKDVTYNGYTHSIEAQNVPNGIDVSYVGNGKINADVYTVTAKFIDKTGNYENPADMTATLTINKATLTGITFVDKTFTYDTKAHSIKISGNIPTCVNVTYTNNDKVNADTYTITASFEDTSGNYIVPEDMSAKLIIQKANVTDITFANKTFTYNGTKRNLEISGTLPSEVTVDYVNNGKINADTYTVIATFTCETDNYNVPEDMTATLTIKKAVYDMNAVTFDNKTVTYNGKTQSLAVSDNLPSGVTVNYTNNNQVNVGQYIVVATFTGDSINYYPIDDMQAMLTINKATYDMSKVQFVGGRFTYDGTSKSIYITGELPQGINVEYINNGKINANTYTVTATFTGDTKNYNKLNDWSASLIIDKATYDMSGISFKNQTFTYDKTEKSALISGNLPKGVQVSYVGNEKTDVGTYSVTAKFNGDSNNYNLIEDMTATLKINQAVPYINEVSCDRTLNVYSKVELIVDTDVKGAITLDNGQALTLGYKTYSWTFIPEDTHNYTNATGTIGLTVCALISYYNDGVLFSSQNIVLNNSAYIPTGTPLREDSNGYTYTFSHWSIEENGVEYNFTNAIMSNLNLYAVYVSEEIVYAVNYYDTKGVEHDNITTYTVSTEFTLLSLEKEHYVFNGWVDEKGKLITQIVKGTFGTLNLYAELVPIEYTINYDLGYLGVKNEQNPISYNVETSVVFEDAIYDKYHDFKGWFLDKEFTIPMTSIALGEVGAVNLYAKWEFSGTYISSISELKEMAYNMSGAYELKLDIDLTNEDSWLPIGDSTNPFIGYFNGAEHKILGKQLFGILEKGSFVGNLQTNVPIAEKNSGDIFNVHSSESYIIKNNLGGSVTYCSGNNGLMISNSFGIVKYSCSYSGFVKSGFSYGGLMVSCHGGVIDNCFAIINCTEGLSFSICGGLVAQASEGAIISDSYTTGKIANYGQDICVGGFVGKIDDSVQIYNCYTDVELWAELTKVNSGYEVAAGGFVAIANNAKIENCFVSGKVTILWDSYSEYVVYYGSFLAVGGENILNCYSTTDKFSLSPPYPNIGTGKGWFCEIKTASYNFQSVNFLRKTFGWDESIWYLQDGQLPKLRFELE